MTGKTPRCLLICLLLAVAFPAVSGAETVYKVRRGDNLSRIAKRFHVKPGNLIEANGLSSDDLRPGDRLTIPGGRRKTEASAAGETARDDSAQKTRHHTVEKGETLTSIAGLYGMSVKELKSLNHIRKPKRVKAGTKILVRNVEAVTPPAEASLPAAPDPQPAGEPKAPEESRVAGENGGAVDPPGGKGALVGIKERLVRAARNMIDIPYRYGGASFIGIDCSAYVRMVFGFFDVVLPRTAREQFQLGKLVGMDNLSIGDLVFFRTYAKFPSHVGIYLGDNKFIHASSKDRKVTIDRLDAPYYFKHFMGARRIPLKDPADEL